ncbi:hypothetical protein KIPB_009796 [Kipferlia bialata]|uniref:Uncharacterized protein n=1 Tax=Kipferlia bialata TaxID=797122 RepID=A0A391NWF5_9EUKA|nr:hypothetical protein KIPB_005834 [Kipferlia bialata]GCA63415.1 hypothetical protein KIPB_009796 [Kipferlia bialata]|eukprot:g5834.t1
MDHITLCFDEDTHTYLEEGADATVQHVLPVWLLTLDESLLYPSTEMGWGRLLEWDKDWRVTLGMDRDWTLH